VGGWISVWTPAARAALSTAPATPGARTLCASVSKTIWRIPALHGGFVQDFGVARRPIEWQGHFRGTAAALATVMAQRDAFLLAATTFTFLDDSDTEYGRCDIEAYDFAARRRIVHETFDWLVPYRLVIMQMHFGET
jgi:hypothetical protein